jgi:uncharacterized protein (TIGR02266 family)
VDKRFARRLFTRIRTLYGIEDTNSLGFTTNISSSGMFLAGRLFQPGTELAISLEPEPTRIISVRGEVRWGLRAPAQLSTVVRSGMGIELISPSEEYLTFLSQLAEQRVRRHPRLDVHIEVRFYHRERFLKEYTENLSQGGLFIVTERQFELDTQLNIDLVIPDLAGPLQVSGRVVYLVDAERAQDLQVQPGIGVKLVEPDPETAAQLQSYVEKLMRLYGE